MKNIFYTCILCLALASCGSGEKRISAESMQSVKAHGIEDAHKVIDAPDSTAMEHAMLEIRATEQRIQQAGHPEAARAYIEAAETELRNAFVIE